MGRCWRYCCHTTIFLVSFTVSFSSEGLITGQLSDQSSEKADVAGSRLSLHLGKSEKQSQHLPSWCRAKRTHNTGPWHLLSDDEYSDESPYLQCGLPPSKPQLPSQRRAARAARSGGIAAPSCASTMTIPKVALLFLTQGDVAHEPLWEKWLASAAGLVPTLCAANAVCARGGFQAFQSITKACGASSLSGQSTYHQQFLFSVYIHAHPDHPLRGRSSVFYGRDNLVQRLNTQWADHSVVEAMRRLVAAALEDPANQRFVLLSESCIPLYSPLIIYQQLMHEWRSRISACALPGWDRSIERYNLRMAAGRRAGGRIPIEKWRKHMHWFSLLRFHAELVANDTEVVDTFARDCFMGYDILCLEPENYRFCIGDEHYVSTLLAVYGLDAETDCMGRLTHAQFSVDSEHPEHPKSYSVSEINATLFRDLRGNKQETITATNFANRSFHRVERFSESNHTWHVPYPDLKQLKPHFYLFARKFPAETADEVLRVLTENDVDGARLNILGGLHIAGQLPYSETNFDRLVAG